MVYILVGVALLGLAVYLWRRRRAARESHMNSLVVLLREPRALNLEVLAFQLEKAIGVPVYAGIPPDEDDSVEVFVGGGPGTYMLHLPGSMFSIHNVGHPYCGEMPHPDMRVQHAVASHRAWMAVDIHYSQAPQESKWRTPGRILSQLVGCDGLLAIHFPTESVAAWSEETPDLLLADDPISSVFGEPSLVPVMKVEDAAVLAEATAQARREFPEFERAFRAGDGSDFTVKAPITRDDNTEHIWVSVEEIRDGVVRGRLENEPVALEGLRLGSVVEVPCAEVDDWVYLRGEERVGEFSRPVFEKMIEDL